MKKPNFDSVTAEACACNGMARCVNNPNIPIEYDSQDKNYFIVHTGVDGTRICVLLYHCFFCGGVVFTDVPSISGPRMGE